MMRVLLRGFLIVLLLAAHGGGARAIEQQVLDDLLEAYLSRPDDDVALRAIKVRENLESYFKANVPATGSTIDPNVTAFVDNLKLALADPRHVGVDDALRATSIFDRTLFYTLADEQLVQAASQNGGDDLFWQRRQAGPVRAATADDLRDAAAAFNRFQQFNKFEVERPLESVFGEVNSAPKAEAINQLRERLTRLYGAEGFPVTPDLLADIAAVQFLLGADRTDSATREWVEALKPLSQALAQSTKSGEPLDARMVSALEGREREEGFRSTVPVATGFLEPADFVQLVAAGYLVDDIGAGNAHGAFAHRIQWRAIMDHAKSNPEAFSHTVLELYTSIGKLDAAIVARNKTVFGLERRQLIWDRVFDLPQKTGEDLSHPEEMRMGLTAVKNILEGLDTALAEEFSSRFKREQQLAAAARKNGKVGKPAELYIADKIPEAASAAASFGGRPVRNLRVRGTNESAANLAQGRDEAEIERQRGKRQPPLAASTSRRVVTSNDDDDDNDAHEEAALDKRPGRKPPAKDRQVGAATSTDDIELPEGTDNGEEIDFEKFEQFDNAALFDSDDASPASEENGGGKQDVDNDRQEEREAPPAEEAD